MSGLQNMYRHYKDVALVTIASSVNQNLALLDVGDHISAESLASIHEGYINVIPILNSDRRCKYVALGNGKDRGKGYVNQIKWLQMNGGTIFVVCSTIGIQIYDPEVCEMQFSHQCKSTSNANSGIVTGACVIQNNILCIGTTIGVVWMFEGKTNNSKFWVLDRFHAHEKPIILIDAMEKYVVTSTPQFLYLWMLDRSKKLQVLRQIQVSGLFSTPTTLKMSSYLILVGYESGEFCVFDILDQNFIRRTIAHKLKVSALDFSQLKRLVLTASEDGFVKLWNFSEENCEGDCVFSTFNENGSVCGAAFLNGLCTEFCIVTANDTKVGFYIENLQEK